MGYKSKVFAAEKVSLSAGYWAEVRPLEGDEADECSAILFGGKLKGYTDPAKTSSVEYTLNNQEYTAAMLSKSIVRWNLDDDDGNILPITEETVRGLAQADQLALLRMCRKINNPLTDEDTRAG